MRICIGLIAVVIVGCGSRGQNPAEDADDLEIHFAQISEPEGMKFGQELVKALNSGEGAPIRSVLREDQIVDRAAIRLPLIDERRDSLSYGIKKLIVEKCGSEKYAKLAREGVRFRLVGFRASQQSRRILIRMHKSDQVMEYLEVPVVPFGNEVQAQDIFNLIAQDSIYRTVRLGYISIGKIVEEGNGDRLTEADRELIVDNNFIKSVNVNLLFGQYQKIVDSYHKLPPKDQGSRIIMLTAISAACRIPNSQDFPILADRYRKAFSSDPAIELKSIEYYNLNKSYDQSIKYVDSLDKAIGGDPYLDLFRAQIYLATEKYPESLKAAERAIQVEPTIADPYWLRIGIYLQQKQYPEVLTDLKDIVTKADWNIDPDELAKMKEYIPFLESPSGKEYIAWYKARK